MIQLYIFSWFFLWNFDWHKNSRFLKRHSTCPAGHFEEKVLAETKTFRPLGNEQEEAGFLVKQFWQSCQLRIACIQRNTFGQKVFIRKEHVFHSLFCFWVKNFQFFGKSLRQRCQNRELSDQKNFLRKFRSNEDTILYIFKVLPKEVWLPKNYRSVRKAFYVYSGTFWGTNFRRKQNFSNFVALSENLPGFWQKSWQSCHNCTPCDHRSFRSKMNFFLKKIQS